MYDTRLIGTWRSDRRRTEQDIAARRDISAAQRRRIVPIFGHLVLRYTRVRCYSTFHGDRDVRSYRVLAKTADSVVIESVSRRFKEEGPSVYHIRFEELGPTPSRYWIGLGSFREFFRRVKVPPC